MSTPIYLVDAITLLGIAKSQPPLLILEARGRTRTSGWRHGQLLPRMYPTPPADGIQDFDFVADPPTGTTLSFLAPITAFHMDTAPPWLRGVRVFGEINQVERRFVSQEPALFETDLRTEPPGRSVQASVEMAHYGIVLSSTDIEARRLIDETTVIEFDEPGEQFPAAAVADGARCHEVTVARMNGWPETKTEMEHKCIVKIGGKCRASMHVPVIYHRTSELRIVATVCLPSEDDLRNAIQDCAREAIAAGVLAGVLSGNLAAFAAALETYLKSCLLAKGVAAANRLSVRLRQHKTPGAWRRL